MFELFTERARQVLVHAQQAARDLGHNYIGTEHQLLGAPARRRGGHRTARVLVALGLTEARLQDGVVRIVGRTPDVTAVRDSRSRRGPGPALETANRERDVLGDRHVGTEHILLGLAARRR